jgi:predicted nucleic acid-binding protein
VVGEQREPDQANALALLTAWAEGKVEIAAPILWQYEVANFLGRDLPEEGEAKMSMLLQLRMRDIPLSQPMITRCFQWMKSIKATFYDACYLAAAQELEGTLVTADERFVRKAEGVGPVIAFRSLKPSEL